MRLFASSLAVLPACTLQTIDLRHGEPLGVACSSSDERLDPATGACAPCIRDTPHPALVCPCAYALHAAPFPYCAGEDAAWECEACTGSIASCSAFDVRDGTVWNCDLLVACCAELATTPGAQPCCTSTSEVVCAADDNLGEYRFSCREPCVGDPCPGGDGDCAAWQTCDQTTETCAPACQPDVEFCDPFGGCQAGPAF